MDARHPTPPEVRTDYVVVTSRTRIVKTFDTKDAAVKWAKGRRPILGPLSVEQITTTVERKAVYRPRACAARAERTAA